MGFLVILIGLNCGLVIFSLSLNRDRLSKTFSISLLLDATVGAIATGALGWKQLRSSILNSLASSSNSIGDNVCDVAVGCD